MTHLPDVLTATYSSDDLNDLAQHTGPFLTVALPSPSALDDAAHRLSVRWKNARRVAEQIGWPSERLEELDTLLAGWPHGEAAAFVVVQSIDGARLEETLMSEIATTSVSIDAHPRLLTILDNRQRTLPHIVVVTDRAGADIAAFDGGLMTMTSEVEGERFQIHRGHPGGWSQHRFQQRAENTWGDNADSVVDAVLAVAEQVDPILIAVAGDVRAQTLVENGLRDRSEIALATLEAGDADGIANEVVRLVDDQHARFLRQGIEQLRAGIGTGSAVSGEAAFEALKQGRVKTLFVHDVTDHDLGAVSSDGAGSLDRPNNRLVDQSIVEAFTTGADVVVIPNVGELTNGVAATLRW